MKDVTAVLRALPRVHAGDINHPFWVPQARLLHLVQKYLRKQLTSEVLSAWKKATFRGGGHDAIHETTGVLFSAETAAKLRAPVWISPCKPEPREYASHRLSVCVSLCDKLERHAQANTLWAGLPVPRAERLVADAVRVGGGGIARLSTLELEVIGCSVRSSDREFTQALGTWLFHAEDFMLLDLTSGAELEAAAAATAAAAAAATAARAAERAQAAAADADALALSRAKLAADTAAAEEAAAAEQISKLERAVVELVPLLDAEIDRVGRKLYCGNVSISNQELLKRWPSWKAYDDERRAVYRSSPGLCALATRLAKIDNRSDATEVQVRPPALEPVYLCAVSETLHCARRSTCSWSCCCSRGSRADGATSSS